MSPEPLAALLHLTGPGVFRDGVGAVWVVRSRRTGHGFDAYHVTWPPGVAYYMTLVPGALGDLREHMRVPSSEGAELGLAEFAKGELTCRSTNHTTSTIRERKP